MAISSLRVGPSIAQTPAPEATLTISGSASTPLTLTIAVVRRLPRKTLRAINPHTKKIEAYEGVSVEDLLRKAGAPQGEQLRDQMMATHEVAEGADGYRVVFSLAELDSGFLDSEVIVANRLDGSVIGPNQGPFKLVAPHEKRPARWGQNVESIDSLCRLSDVV